MYIVGDSCEDENWISIYVAVQRRSEAAVAYPLGEFQLEEKRFKYSNGDTYEVC